MRLSLETLADKIKAIGVVLAFIVGASAVVVRYYKLPTEVQVLSTGQKDLRKSVDQLSVKVDLLEKRVKRVYSLRRTQP